MGCRAEGKKAAGMICGGQRVFYFRFSIFVFSIGFRPPGKKEIKKKNEERKGYANVIKVGNEFSIFVFSLGFRSLAG
jgi:hypothetical protein